LVEAFRQHPDDAQEGVALQLAIRPGAPDRREQVVFAPFASRDFRHDLLGDNVERTLRHDQPIELAAAHRVEESRALDQLVAREREKPSLGHAGDGMVGAADALQKTADGAR